MPAPLPAAGTNHHPQAPYPYHQLSSSAPLPGPMTSDFARIAPQQQRRQSVLVAENAFNDSEFAPLIAETSSGRERGRSKPRRHPDEATSKKSRRDRSVEETGKDVTNGMTKNSIVKTSSEKVHVESFLETATPKSKKVTFKNAKKFEQIAEESGNPEFPKSRRYCCGIFKSRSGCRRFWIAFIILFFGGFGTAGFFLWPRYPVVVVSDPTFSSEGQAFQTFGDLSKASSSSPFTIQLNMQVDISVFSPNYWDVRVDRLTFEGNLMDDSGNPISSTTANGIVSSLTFKKMENSTFQLPISLIYSITTPSSIPALLASDPAITTLASSCGLVDPNRKSNLKLSYNAKVYITPISWLGLVPQQNGRVSFPCPIPVNAFETLIKLL
ncbi:hypothetical protein HDU67_004099 [Dinochytrium kinnereticum]|nr:hypothetical protein HDU67_004099 [Dinochytrium kinnereticum]